MAVSEPEIKIASEVTQFIAQPRKMLIDGAWVGAALAEPSPCTIRPQARYWLPLLRG